MTTVIGYVLLVIAVGWIGYKMNVSYNSAGGTAFAVPVYDAAIYPPILIGVAIYLIGIEWPWWGYVVAGVALVPIVAGGIRLMEEVGDKEL
jgi:hypothetical protein